MHTTSPLKTPITTICATFESLTHFATTSRAYKLSPAINGSIVLREVCGPVLAQFQKTDSVDPFAAPETLEIENARCLDWALELADKSTGWVHCVKGVWEALLGADQRRHELGAGISPIEALLKFSRVIATQRELQL